MKTTLKGLLIAILFLFNINSFTWGQELADPSWQKIIYLLEGNDKKEIVLPISEPLKLMSLRFIAAVSEGEIIMEIFDPSGERRKKSSVGSQINPDKKIIKAVGGFLPFDNPMQGNWIIKISCKNVKGSFVVGTNLKLYSENQPSKTITGTVTYANNKPLWGAIILIKGTTMGTVTDKLGNFSLNVPDNAEFLLFYTDGTKTQEVKIGKQTRFTIAFKEE